MGGRVTVFPPPPGGQVPRLEAAGDRVQSRALARQIRGLGGRTGLPVEMGGRVLPWVQGDVSEICWEPG